MHGRKNAVAGLQGWTREHVAADIGLVRCHNYVELVIASWCVFVSLLLALDLWPILL